MTEVDSSTATPTGLFVEVIGEDEDPHKSNRNPNEEQVIPLYAVFRRLITEIFFPNPEASANEYSTNLFHRIKTSVSNNLPLLREALRNTGHNVLLWTRRGSPLRALIVISVGTITLLVLTGFLVFTLFLLVATFNAIVISLLVSLVAVGGFLALFFACVTAIYIGALSIASLVIFTATISAIIAALIVTGWIGFFCSIWLLTKKSVDIAKHSLNMTGSAISAYSSARHAKHNREPHKVSTD